MKGSKFDVDMWYRDSRLDADEVTWSWSDFNLRYQGNIWKSGKAIGDFWAKEFSVMEKLFPQLNFIFNE